jgi:hypothetical protein
MNETELQIRLRRAKEALAYAIDRENEARRALRSAEESRRAAKERYDALFIEEEQAEVRRRKAAYNHCTR